MVDASELPFRLLAREFGTDLCYTPMLHSRLLVEQAGYLAANFSTSAADRPLIAQLCGNDPATVLAAGKRLETRGVDAIDLNLGCPQGIAKRGHYGAFLLDEPDTIVAMVKALAGGLAIPVTCKIRVLPTLEATLALARAARRAGWVLELLSLQGIAAVSACLGSPFPAIQRGGAELVGGLPRLVGWAGRSEASGLWVSR
jgi:tRNA-dihydrouridine synthase 1